MQHFRTQAAALAAAVVAAACVSNPHTYTIADGHEGAPGVDTVVLLPPNVAVNLVPELAAGADRLSNELFAYLRQRGLGVSELSAADAGERWLAAAEAAQQAGLTPGFDSTASVFVKQLRQGLDFDAVVMPAVLLHKVRLKGRTGYWEGVKRELRFISKPAESAWGADGFPVTSLHMIVFAPDGQRVFTGTGGLDFVHDADFSTSLMDGRVEIRWQPDPLRNVDHIRESIRVALTPYLADPAAPE